MLSGIRKMGIHARACWHNRHGKPLQQKLLVLESDDWGAIRTPSKEFAGQMKAKGYLYEGPYRLDALATPDDLSLLFEVLQSVKDLKGNAAVLTANVIMNNPDFERIAEADFQSYFREPFTASLQRDPQHASRFSLWKKGMQAGVFHPEFHGTEHLQVGRWLRALQNNEAGIRDAFEHRATWSGRGDYSYMETLDWDTPEEIEQQKQQLQLGLQQFETIFGYAAQSFIAPCYNWDPELEPTLEQAGIRWIQGLREQLAPTGAFDRYHSVPHYSGQTRGQLRYGVRNCFLEPGLHPNIDWVDRCLTQIDAAFRLGKPAVICTHRLNYIGYIEEKNRSRGLRDLQAVLKKALQKWPDLHFVRSNDLYAYYD